MRYPSVDGVAVSPYELGFAVPLEAQEQVRGLTTIHHAQFERHRYNEERISSVFRNLVTNTYPLLAVDHRALHERYTGPRKPKDVQMIDVVEDYLAEHGVIHLVRERQIRAVYGLQGTEWDLIKKGYRSRINAQKKRAALEPVITRRMMMSPDFEDGIHLGYTA